MLSVFCLIAPLNFAVHYHAEHDHRKKPDQGRKHAYQSIQPQKPEGKNHARLRKTQRYVRSFLQKADHVVSHIGNYPAVMPAKTSPGGVHGGEGQQGEPRQLKAIA